MRINGLPFFNKQTYRRIISNLYNEDYSWIWEPFEDRKDSKLAQTACLAAKIIANSSPNQSPKVKFTLDPRIVIPLCAIALQKDLNNLDELNIQETFSRGDAVNYFLEITQPTPRWRYLFNSLSTQLQYQLCYRLSNYRLPRKNDWRNLLKDDFENSIEALVLFFLYIILFSSFFCTIYFVHDSKIIFLSWTWMNIVPFWLAILVICVMLYYRGKTRDYKARNPLKGILDNTINN